MDEEFIENLLSRHSEFLVEKVVHLHFISIHLAT